MADSTLTAIRTKVRRLTRSPNTAQITDAQIDEYVNTFIQYDFPEHLRLFTLRETFTFFTQPFIDVYDSDNPATELDNFENVYTSVHEPIFIDGNRVPLYQDRDKFYGVYPLTNTRETVATGDGATMLFNGTLTNAPLVRGNLLFSSVAADFSSLELHDPDNELTATAILSGSGTGIINYITGAYTLTFSTAPGNGEDIDVHYIPYEASVPQAVLYHNNAFTVRPIPDQAYRIQMEVYRRPTELLASGASPELEQWWQLIAYGASVKLFQDRTDEEGVRMLMPEFDKQMRLALRKTIVQQTNDRVATIYTDTIDGNCGNRSWPYN